ncbi:MAG: hypothetical protein ABGX31_08210, partial [bacterium]
KVAIVPELSKIIVTFSISDFSEENNSGAPEAVVRSIAIVRAMINDKSHLNLSMKELFFRSLSKRVQNIEDDTTTVGGGGLIQ